MWLFLAFLAVPLIEIALFIQVGGLIGLWPTLLIVVLTAIIGASMVRSQGRAVMNELRRSFSQLNDPAEPLAHGAMVLFSGALLLTPGFFTDIVGFALLVPGVRAAVFRYARSRVTVQRFDMGGAPRDPYAPESEAPPRRRDSADDVVEGDYVEIPKEGRDGSGWTRH